MKVYYSILVFTSISAVFCDKEVPNPPVDQEHTINGEHNPHHDHEAVIGNKRLEHEFDEMSPDESKRRLAEFVAQHDLNKDGIISREELVKWILDSYRTLDEEEADDKMREDDIDNDNQVTWRELVKTEYSYDLEDIEDFKKKTEDQEPEMKEFLQMLDDEEKRFMAADIDSNGVLERKEFQAYYHPNEYLHMYEVEIQRALRTHDKNNDGFISKKEFIGDVKDRETFLVEEENFKNFDKDKNGKLDRAEIQGWVIQDNKQAAEEEVTHLFSEADDNKNGELSLTEILDHYDDFVGAATDYAPRDEL